MSGKVIFWSGDFSNGPKQGMVVAHNGSNLTIRWSDGCEQVVPEFVVVARHGWRVA